MVREAHLILRAPPQGDLSPVGLKEGGMRIRRARETSGSETGTLLSGTNARPGRTVQQ